MSKTKWVIAGILVIGAASCQLVSGVGDYSFAEAGPGSGGAGTGQTVGVGGGETQATISWAYQLRRQDTPTSKLNLTNLYPAGNQAAILLGSFGGELQFDDPINDEVFPVSAETAQDGFIFVAAAGTELIPPIEIETTSGSEMTPQAAVLEDDGIVLAGPLVGGLAGDSNLGDVRALVVGKWRADGTRDYVTAFFYEPGGEVRVTGISLSQDDYLTISGYSKGPFQLTNALGVPDQTDAFIAKLNLTAIRNQEPVSSHVDWAVAIRGAGDQRVVGMAARAEGGHVLYGDFDEQLELYDGDLSDPEMPQMQGGAGSLFLMPVDDDGTLVTSNTRYVLNDSGEATAVSLTRSDTGRFLVSGHFEGELGAFNATPESIGTSALFLIEYDASLGERFVTSFGEGTASHRMAGAGYITTSDDSHFIMFGAECRGALALVPEDPQPTGTTFDVCLGALVETPPGSSNYAPVGLSRFGDQSSDQSPIATVTHNTEVIVYGMFRGTLIDENLFSNTKDVDDGFAIAFDLAGL